MKKMGGYAVVFFIFAYLITLLITVPASLLDSYLQYASQGRLVLANASGTIWSGSATPALRPKEGRLIALHALNCDVDALSLLTGKIKARLQWNDLPTASAMEAAISFNRIELQHVFFLLPARILSEVSPILKPSQLHGQLQLHSEQLILSKYGVDGAAVVDWEQAGSALSSIEPLGNYRLTLNGTGGRINIGLSTISGVLLLERQGNWSAPQGLEFHGKAHASPGNYGNLTELLHHLGPEVSPEMHAFSLTPQ